MKPKFEVFGVSFITLVILVCALWPCAGPLF